MNDLVEWTNGLIEHRTGWAAIVFGLIAFGESTAFVGAVLPATPALLLVGGLIGMGRLDPWEVVPAAILGAILGYGLSYYLGRLVGARLTRGRWLRNHRRAIGRARLLFRRYGPASLLFGRYLLGPFQSLLPFIAGGLGMNRRRFWIINIISGALWVPVCLAPGFLAARGGSYFEVDSAWQDWAVAIALIVSVGAALLCLAALIARALSFSWPSRSG